MKILAVDDDLLMLELLTEMLRVGGYGEVETATSAEEAVHRLTTEAEPFDLFLLDIVMPDVDGIALCRIIRKSVVYRTAPILMMTSMMEKRHVDDAFRAGASDYVTKPFDLVELVTRVRLAERQALANVVVQDTTPVPTPHRDRGDEPWHVALTDPIRLDDVEGLIGVPALENYLLQLSRSHLATTSVVAFRIFEVANIYERCSGLLYRDVLADVAESILAVLSGHECLMAHAGNGAFCGVIAAGQTFDPEEVELMVNSILFQLEPVDDQGKPLDVRVSVGTPKPVGMMRSGRVAVQLLHGSIDDLRWIGRPPVTAADTRHSLRESPDTIPRSA